MTANGSVASTAARYELGDVTRVYRTGAGDVRAVDGITLSIGAGEFVAIEGPSGSGKSTLLQLLGALEQPTGGTLRIDGQEVGGLDDGELTGLRNRSIGFVFQHFNLIPTLTAADNVAAALAPMGVGKAQRQSRSVALLGSVGLADRVDHLPSRLSGGEQQRVAIARALANRPRIVLADEPTGNLDSRTTDEVVELLAALSDDDVTVVLVTHAEHVAARAARRIVLRDGRVVDDTGVPDAARTPPGDERRPRRAGPLRAPGR
ncbi:MAG TPA: ABC transporter ATP-binding protein [Acidimicrobiales bacterium]|nr:ABC transporter ATP-binding protein [Acidimicrobiales bacterium]